jgi:hypothetical protein
MHDVALRSTITCGILETIKVLLNVQIKGKDTVYTPTLLVFYPMIYTNYQKIRNAR